MKTATYEKIKNSGILVKSKIFSDVIVTDRLPTDALPIMATSSPETGRRQEWKLASNSWKINVQRFNATARKLSN